MTSPLELSEIHMKAVLRKRRKVVELQSEILGHMKAIERLDESVGEDYIVAYQNMMERRHQEKTEAS